jgi:hypothetical protein
MGQGEFLHAIGSEFWRSGLSQASMQEAQCLSHVLALLLQRHRFHLNFAAANFLFDFALQ